MWIFARSHLLPEHFTTHLPPDGRIAVPEGSTVQEVLDHLKIPAETRDSLLTFVNGRASNGEDSLQAEDVLVFFPSVTGG